MSAKPNIVYVFADQWRAQATGYAGDPNVQTPHLDRLAEQSLNLTHAIAGVPVCTPARATLMTGQRPLSHGVFVNDVQLDPQATTLAKTFKETGYHTAYIGKWHIDGRGRSNPIPEERRQGFEYWKTLECTHDYNNSHYYSGDSTEQLTWETYDARAQTRDAQQYIRQRDRDAPFLLMLSWGPPHNPYETALEEFQNLYDPAALELRPNVPDQLAPQARQWLAGYYAHCSALDACVGDLMATLDEEGIAEDTLFVFTSDHGDMLGSQGMERKQKPWDESICVPFLLRYPARFGPQGHQVDALLDAPDIMPTLLGLCDIPIPNSVEGFDFTDHIEGGDDPCGGCALLACYHPFGEWHCDNGGREFRGLRTHHYTYVRALHGPWLLYDNTNDPYQLNNLIDRNAYTDLQIELDYELQRRLESMNDKFLPGMQYIEKWGYEVDEQGTVPYAT